MLCLGGPTRVEFEVPEALWRQAQSDDLSVSNEAHLELLEICPAEANRGHVTASAPVCDICGGGEDGWTELSGFTPFASSLH
jgi:hypothetical protein